jgi:hypothetical protein
MSRDDMADEDAPRPDNLQDRPFSFYPPILGIDHNEWMLVKETWSEALVRNTGSPLELAIPRRYFGEVSSTDDPVRIVGLRQELEFKTGAVWPHRRRVFEMTNAPQPRYAPSGETPPDPGVLGRIAGSGLMGAESRIGRLILVALGGLGLLSLLLVAVIKFTPVARPTYSAKDQQYLEFNREDDAGVIMRRLGRPSDDVTRAGGGELFYRKLVYQDRGYMVILMGGDEKGVRYIGTLGLDWRPLHYVEFAKGTSTAPMLRTLKRF